MYSPITSEHSIQQLLYEEREYFNSVIEHIDEYLIKDWSGSNKTFEALLETRRQLIETLHNKNSGYLEELVDLENGPDPEQNSATYLTHTLIIIDAKILDLLHTVVPAHT